MSETEKLQRAVCIKLAAALARKQLVPSEYAEDYEVRVPKAVMEIIEEYNQQHLELARRLAAFGKEPTKDNASRVEELINCELTWVSRWRKKQRRG